MSNHDPRPGTRPAEHLDHVADDRLATMPEVLAAMERAIARPARRRGRHLLRTLGISAGLVFASGSALAATGQWHPFDASNGRTPPSIARNPIPKDQRETLAVLRRPQTDEDRSPMVTATMRFLDRSIASGVHLDAIRHVGQFPMPVSKGGIGSETHDVMTDVTLIPLRRMGPAGAEFRETVQRNTLCLATSFDAWPDRQARPVVEWFVPSAKKGRPRPTPQPRPTALKDRITGGMNCADGHQIRTKGLQFGGNLSMGTTGGLVPDGVASVRATASRGDVISTPVRNNIYYLKAPVFDNGRSGVGPRFKQGTLQWVAADGHVIRTF
jgi:hypothetical protein